MRPIAWTIAGSDSGGGAGIQADLKAMNALGVHACTVVTAITAQNPERVRAIELVSEPMIREQLEALKESLLPRAVKTGMLGSDGIASRVAEALDGLDAFVVCDPVLVATSGARLSEISAPARLFARADLVTPNLIEADALEKAGLWRFKRALIKGGHDRGELARDHFVSPEGSFLLSSKRLSLSSTHGTGCTLSAAITAASAMGYDLPSAVVLGKIHLNRTLGHPDPLPWIGSREESFPTTGAVPLGFYPIVDRARWLERLLPLGVTTVQLRVKDLAGAELEAEIQSSVTLAKKWNARLFINDYWELALRYDAYGVHLGQEDLDTADLGALRRSGLRLGVSTHSLYELARAKAVGPSYLAFGPIFPTTIKAMRFAPQGSGNLERWRGLVPEVPLVAIGGITLDNVPELRRSGAAGIAVITDLLRSPDPEGRCRAYLEACA